MKCKWRYIQLSTIQFSHLVVSVSATPWIAALQASLSITNTQSSPKLMCIKLVMQSSHLSSVVPFSSCPQSLPASGSFPMSQLLHEVAEVLEFQPQHQSFQGTPRTDLLWTGWISLQSKGLSRVFSNTTAQKHQFFSAQPSSQSNSHIHTWLLEKP